MIRTPLKAAVLAAAALAGTAAMILPTAAQAQAVISVQIGPPHIWDGPTADGIRPTSSCRP